MIDALTHIHDTRLAATRGEVLRAAAARGVTDLICANADDAAAQLELAGGLAPRVWRALGVHPQRVDGDWLAACHALGSAWDAPDVVAVGEIGLDDRVRMPSADLQEAACLAQLALARAHGLPVILHCVGRIGRLVELLDVHGAPPAGLVWHAFAGPAEIIPRLVELGGYFSFGGLVTRPHAKKCHKAALAVPEERLLVESDAPDMAAEGWEGLSAPAMIVDVLACLAALRGASFEALAKATARNAQRLYKIAPSGNTEPQ